MNANNSPWLHQLKATRPIDIINENVKADIIIVGAGISGVMTAYFTLKYTNKSVIILEGNKVAHGATGHNAGQIVADFERELSDLVSEYGLEKAAAAERDVRGAWLLLEEIFEEANLETPFSTFVGYNGFREHDHIIEELKDNAIRSEAGLQTYPVYIANDFEGVKNIPSEFKNLYELVPRADILSLLETKDHSYAAAVALRKGCVNSALLCEELIGYLLAKYKGRFALFEHTSVENLELEKESTKLFLETARRDNSPEEKYSASAEKVIICTNGFERLSIKNLFGGDIDTKFHQMINGDVGYMAGFVEELKEPPTALGYYDQKGDKDVYGTKDYFYITRRPFEMENKQIHNLICIGGPEKEIGQTQDYDRRAEFSSEMGERIDDFAKKTLKNAEKRDLEYRFQWHGVMCYTPTKMRIIGPEPKNQTLIYNLGCNGVGILASIYGGWKIAKILAGEKFASSIFDPRG